MRGVFLALALLIPMAQAASLEDPTGDVRVEFYETAEQPMPSGFDGLDLVSLLFEETPEDIVITVGVAGLPECYGGVCADGADLRTHFKYGEMAYFVQMGMTFDGFGIARLNEDLGGGNGRLITQDLRSEVSAADNTFRLYIPRELLSDESGAPLVQGRAITDIWTNSYGQFNLGGPTPDLQGQQDWFVTRDDMGLDAPTELVLQYGGIRGEGPVALSVEAPFRASNGGAATYAYRLLAENTGDAGDFSFALQGVPEGWTTAIPNGTLHLAAGERREFTIIVETPMGHQHGGSDIFVAHLQRMDDETVWSSVDLGVHYLDVPQPAGHHPDLWLHGRDIGTFGTFSSVAGGTNGDMWMNTLADDADDHGVDISAYAYEGGAIWTACLRPELRLGLDLNASKEGFLDITVEATKPYQGVSYSARLLHVGPGSDIVACYPNWYAEREQTTILEFTATEAGDAMVGDTTNHIMDATVTPDGERVPFVDGSTLVLEIRAQYGAGVEYGPGGLMLKPGALLRLPIDEYFDERPAGFVAGSVEVVGEVEDFQETVVASKESPMPVLLVIAALWIARRR